VNTVSLFYHNEVFDVNIPPIAHFDIAAQSPSSFIAFSVFPHFAPAERPSASALGRSKSGFTAFPAI